MFVVCERKDAVWGDSIRVRKVVVLPLDKATWHETIRNRHVVAEHFPDWT